MAIATERWSTRRSSKGADLRWTAEREFDVIEAENEADVYTAQLIRSDLPHNGRVPVLGDQHPLFPLLIVDNVGAKRDGLGKYLLTATYTIPLNGTTPDGDGDPLSQPIRWQWMRSNEQVDVDRDYFGNPIVNSAREQFQNPAPRTITRRILEVRRWEPFYDEAKAEIFENTVNDSVFTISGVGSWGKHVVRCNTISPTGEHKVGSDAVDVGYQFEIRPDGWRSRHLDAGFSANTGANEPLPLYHSSGDRISVPALLSGRGTALDLSLRAGSHLNPVEQVELEAPPNGAELDEALVPGGNAAIAVYLRYQIDGFTNFNGMGL